MSVDSDVAALVREAKLIVWDEAPMTHKHVFEAVDRTLRDVMRVASPELQHRPFGGKVVVLGGDFRQVLPVVSAAPCGWASTVHVGVWLCRSLMMH